MRSLRARTVAVGLTALSVSAALTGCTSGQSTKTCGPMPVSSGPDRDLATLTLTGPTTGASGSTVTMQARVTVTVALSDLSTPASISIVRDGKVVGAYRGAVGGTGLALGAGETTSVPTDPLLLSGCPRGPVDVAHPDSTRRPLPAGNYQLVATIDTGDAARGYGHLASAPVPFEITR